MEIITRAEAKAQGLKRYFTGKPCKRGHVIERVTSKGECPECKKIGWQAYYKANKSEIRLNQGGYAKNNKEKVRGHKQKWLTLNRETVNIASKKRRLITSNRLSLFIRNSLQRILTDWNGGAKSGELCCGYTVTELKQRIESLWLDGMSWSNRSEWHIDHIKPISLFIKEGITDPAIINALSNLQPLWAKDNLSKGAKYNEM